MGYEIRYTLFGFNVMFNERGVVLSPEDIINNSNTPEWNKAILVAAEGYEQVSAYIQCKEYLRIYGSNDITDSWIRREQNTRTLGNLVKICETVLYGQFIQSTTNYDKSELGTLRRWIIHARQQLERVEARDRKDALKKQKKEHPTKGFVYLLQSPTTAYKIGKTKDPKDRLETFHVKLPFEVEFIHLIETPQMHKLESELKAKFASKCINGEWFNLSSEDVEYIKSL